MTFSHVKLGRAVNFMKYLTSIVSLIYLLFFLNKIMFRPSNLLNLSELVVAKLTKSILKILPIFLFLPDLLELNVNISIAYT